jgi:uncharacterized protein (DUF1501 family)
MTTRTPDSNVPAIDPVSRRDFLRVGGLGVVGLSVAETTGLAAARERQRHRNCILVLMTGGASQLDTFDPKPEAPAEIRGPSRAIATAVPGLAFAESLPRLAVRADRFAVIRSLSHRAAPIHETGLQLLQTGRLVRDGRRFPAFGSVIGRALGPRRSVAPYVIVGEPLGNLGVAGAHLGQSGGMLGAAADPLQVRLDGEPSSDAAATSASLPPAGDEPEALRRLYGETPFGRKCLRARQLVEQGVRTVTVNLFSALAGKATWDCHARPSAPATLYDYRDRLGPQLDHAVAGLLDDLQTRGLYESTLVLVAGEFGRTPRINDAGGRDHWPGVWSMLVGGCGVQGGRVLGASDARGSAPAARPVHPGELVATVYERLGVDLASSFTVDEQPREPLVDHAPIAELL